MQWRDISFRPPRKTLREFAGLWIVFFGGFAVWQYLGRGNSTLAAALGALALTVGPAGLVRPEWMRPIFVSWMVLAFPIGWTVSQVLTALIFFGLFTPVALLFRLTGRDALARARRPGRETYWAPKPIPTDLRRYFQQF